MEAKDNGQEPQETIFFEKDRDWKVEALKEVGKGGRYGFQLTPSKGSGSKRGQGERKRVQQQLFSDSEVKRDLWVSRLKRVCMNEATHGIEIQNQVISDHPLVQGKLKGQGDLELSVWDFAGQHEYYHNHHFFLSNRALFLVLWDLSKAEEGLKGLEFWFRSLSSNLPVGTSEKSFSIVVVGTYLDHPSVSREDALAREEKVRELAAQAGLSPQELRCYEVSCLTLENIDSLWEGCLEEILSHSYLGERVPKSYLAVEEGINELRRTRMELPLVDLSILQLHCRQFALLEIGTIQRALRLLTLWGECVYFQDPPELETTVFLDPKFLTKDVLAQFFNPRLISYYQNGMVKHSDLILIWSMFKGRTDFDQIASILIALMIKFEVCFTLESDRDKPFFEQRSLVPALLPEKLRPDREKKEVKELNSGEREKLAKFHLAWPRDPPFQRFIQLERIIKFNVVPMELVSRLLVRLHPLIQEGLVWRNDVLIFDRSENSQGWIHADLDHNRFVVALRGSDLACCMNLMDFIIREVMLSLSRHPGVTWIEAIRSPYDPDISLDVTVVKEDAARGEDERTLVCPSSLLPIKAEVLLLAAGYSTPEAQEEDARAPWNVSSKKELIFSILEGNWAEQGPLFDLFKELYTYMGGELKNVKRVYAMNNMILKSSFYNYREVITEKHRDTSTIFKRDDWKYTSDWKQRKNFLLHLSQKINHFRRKNWNDGSKVLCLLPISTPSHSYLSSFLTY